MLLIPWLSLDVLAQETCRGEIGLAPLEAGLSSAEVLFKDLEPAAFEQALAELSLSLPCLREAISPPLAARLHILVGLELYGGGMLGEASASFSSARALDPEGELLAALVPAGHELHGSLALAPIEGPRVALSPPAEGQILFDGSPKASRPADRPAIVQILGAQGAVLVTRYLLPGDPMPAYPIAVEPPPPPAASATLPTGTERRRARGAWLALASAGAASSAALYGLAGLSASALGTADDTRLSDGAWRLGVQQRTNTLVLSSGITLAIGGVGAAGYAWSAQGRSP